MISSKFPIYGSLVSTEVAQSVTSLFLPGIISQGLVESVIHNIGSTATYTIECPSGVDADKCNVNGDMTAVEGPQTAILSMTDTNLHIFAYTSCYVENTATAPCTSIIGGPGAGANTRTTIQTITIAASQVFPITIISSTSISLPMDSTTGLAPSQATSQSPTASGGAYKIDANTRSTALSFALALINIFIYI